MCGGYRLDANPEELAGVLSARRVQLDLPWPSEVFPGTRAPVVLMGAGESAGEPLLGLLQWGLVPHWASSPGVGRKLFNARVETLAERPSFRDSFRRHRCLVPVRAFYEWSGERGSKAKHVFSSSSIPWLTLAGLWASWRGPGGEKLGTFTVVTTRANAGVRSVHPRMPLVVPEHERGAWISRGAPATDLTTRLDAYTAGLVLERDLGD